MRSFDSSKFSVADFDREKEEEEEEEEVDGDSSSKYYAIKYICVLSCLWQYIIYVPVIFLHHNQFCSFCLLGKED